MRMPQFHLASEQQYRRPIYPERAWFEARAAEAKAKAERQKPPCTPAPKNSKQKTAQLRYAAERDADRATVFEYLDKHRRNLEALRWPCFKLADLVSRLDVHVNIARIRVDAATWLRSHGYHARTASVHRNSATTTTADLWTRAGRWPGPRRAVAMYEAIIAKQRQRKAKPLAGTRLEIALLAFWRADAAIWRRWRAAVEDRISQERVASEDDEGGSTGRRVA